MFKTRVKAQFPSCFLTALLGDVSQALHCRELHAIILRKIIKKLHNAKASLSMGELLGL